MPVNRKFILIRKKQEYNRFTIRIVILRSLVHKTKGELPKGLHSYGMSGPTCHYFYRHFARSERCSSRGIFFFIKEGIPAHFDLMRLIHFQLKQSAKFCETILWDQKFLSRQNVGRKSEPPAQCAVGAKQKMELHNGRENCEWPDA